MTKEFNIVDHVITELAGDVPVQGFDVGGDVQSVVDQLNAGTITIAELVELYPSFTADEIQANWDAINKENNYVAPTEGGESESNNITDILETLSDVNQFVSVANQIKNLYGGLTAGTGSPVIMNAVPGGVGANSPYALNAANNTAASTNDQGWQAADKMKDINNAIDFVNKLKTAKDVTDVGTTAFTGVDPGSIIFNLALRAMGIGSKGSQATPMTPAEKELDSASQVVDQAISLLDSASVNDFDNAGASETVEATLAEAFDIVNALPDSGLEFFGDTKDSLLTIIEALVSSDDATGSYTPYAGPTTNQAMGKTEVTQADINAAVVKATAARDTILGDSTLSDAEKTSSIQASVADILLDIGIAVEQSTINAETLQGDALGDFVDRITVVEEVVTEDSAASSGTTDASTDASTEDAATTGTAATTGATTATTGTTATTATTATTGATTGTAATTGTGVTDDSLIGAADKYNYSWIYDNGVFVYQPFDNNGKRIENVGPLESISVSDVVGAEDQTFNEGDTVSIIFNADGTKTLEHGGVLSDAEQKRTSWGEALGKFLGDNISWQDLLKVAATIYGEGTLAANQAAMAAAAEKAAATTTTTTGTTCTGGKISDGAGGCKCPTAKPNFVNGNCEAGGGTGTCTGGRVKVDGKCKCAGTTPNWNATTGKCEGGGDEDGDGGSTFPTSWSSPNIIEGEPGELVDIDYLYDIGGTSIFAPPLEEAQEDSSISMYPTFTAADGGIVISDIDELIKYLRG